MRDTSSFIWLFAEELLRLYESSLLCPASTHWLLRRVTTGFGLRTSISMVSLVCCPPPLAVRWMVAFPVLLPVFKVKNTSWSPGWLNLSDCWLAPTICTPPPDAWSDTVTFFTWFSIAKIFTGTVISSWILSTRGKVDNIINGVRTKAVFSALPYAPSCPATTMARTEPTYIGSFSVCVWLLPFPR